MFLKKIKENNMTLTQPRGLKMINKEVEKVRNRHTALPEPIVDREPLRVVGWLLEKCILFIVWNSSVRNVKSRDSFTSYVIDHKTIHFRVMG